MIDTFAVDYMHAFLQNTVRRFLNYIQEAKMKNSYQPRLIWQMSNIWESFKFPVEFGHQNTLNFSKSNFGKLDIWKANQLRQFALYGSDMIFEEIFDSSLLVAWRGLVVAMRILSGKSLYLSFNDQAYDLICYAQESLA
jgi:hypothetical protein